mgnify:CR=1 FL=1
MPSHLYSCACAKKRATWSASVLSHERTCANRAISGLCGDSGGKLWTVTDAAYRSDSTSNLAVGDIIATPVTGAYGHSMGSNYNKVMRPAVVFCSEGADRLVVRRETIEDLLATDLG